MGTEDSGGCASAHGPIYMRGGCHGAHLTFVAVQASRLRTAKAPRSQNNGHIPGITKSVAFFPCRINCSGCHWDVDIERWAGAVSRD